MRLSWRRAATNSPLRKATSGAIAWQPQKSTAWWLGSFISRLAPPAAELEKLFVCPDRMERGIGRILFEWAVAAARQGECDVLTVASDPGAAAFYRRMGCRDSGEAPSGSIPGRTLPRLKLIL